MEEKGPNLGGEIHLVPKGLGLALGDMLTPGVF